VYLERDALLRPSDVPLPHKGMTVASRAESLLDGFEPNFDFEPAPPIPPAEFGTRIEHLREVATEAGHDVLLLHTSSGAHYSTSNDFLRYACDWQREGVLVVPTDRGRGAHLFSFITESVLLPPAGEPIGVEAIWQIGPVTHEYAGRSGDPEAKLVEACVKLLKSLGYESGSLGTIGDMTSNRFWSALKEEIPRAKLQDETRAIQQMQRIRSENERAQIRTAAQLLDIGYQAACHVTKIGVTDFEIYASFSFAQMARGGETGDSYQIGVNRWGTHCGKPYGHIVRRGDLINLYFSAVTYHGYRAQAARMMAAGELTAKQEATLEMCTEAVRRAETLIRPGVRFSDLHRAAFSVYVERGYLNDDATSAMPFNWAPMDDGTARRVPQQHVVDEDYERTGRTLNHVYPAVAGPHNPNIGHSIGMSGPKFNITSHNDELAEPGMAFVLHAQWLDPLSCGANIGDCYLVSETGGEKLTCHSPLETFRVPVD